ncbi:MAG TPA: hypothetical protein VLA09_01850 [Longimicrobiales bacterium]|nr:hypothetical protein [Longimicrobiales bacterium]
MPSETVADPQAVVEREPTPAERALAEVRAGVEAFRSAVAAAEAEVRDEILGRTAAESFGEERALVELGPFAIGRIDPERFARLLGVSESELTPESIDVLSRADRILAGFAGSSRHVVEVEPGGDLRDVVKEALARLGQAFGAARAVELARAGMFDPEAHGHLLEPLPFRLWNRAERHLAPPLVVEVRGEDCLPAGLGEFLDGEVKIVLVASGPTTPAPLARLITPGTFVAQTEDPSELARLVSSRHPGVALLFDEERAGQACFVHDPDAGAAPWDRLEVGRMPADADVGRGRRAPVWLEELVHLRALAEGPGVAAGPVDRPSTGGPAEPGGAAGDAAEAVEPADRLAAWLLANTDLSGA